jgi:hypothetical protein
VPKQRAPAADGSGPKIVVSRLDWRGALSGSVEDASGVARVRAAVAIRRRGRCRWWSRRRESFVRRPRSCGRPRWMPAKVRSRDGKLVWRLRLGGRIPNGRYVVAVAARDKRGNLTKLAGQTAARIRVRR